MTLETKLLIKGIISDIYEVLHSNEYEAEGAPCTYDRERERLVIEVSEIERLLRKYEEMIK